MTTTPSTTDAAAEAFDLRRVGVTAGFVILACVLMSVIYARALHAPLIFDDSDTLVNNSSIRALWPPSRPLRPPNNSTLTSRPLVNLTFALQYAVQGLDVPTLHAVDFGLHLWAALLLYGIVWRTLDLLGRAGSLRNRLLAAAAATLWLVHPLNTEAVVYITQRTELMFALALLGTLYASIRAWTSPHWRGWVVTAILACAAGMASKEVMIGAPLIVWIYDRTFISGGFLKALRRSKALYAGLFATWIVLAIVVLSGHRSLSAGLGHGITPFQYLVGQSRVILWYLRLCFWPHPLTISYTRHLAPLAEAWPYCLAVLGLLALTLALLWRKSPIGFVAACGFIILAPSSSLMPIASEIVAERRMYLPLAGIVVLVVCGIAALFDRLQKHGTGGDDHAAGPAGVPRAVVGTLAVAAVLAAALTATAILRVRDYRDEIGLWKQSLAASPGNAVALQNLAVAQAAAGQFTEALANLQEAARIEPHDWRIALSLARTWLQLGDLDKAKMAADLALKIKPTDDNAPWILGEVASQRGRFDEAIDHYRVALRRAPRSAGAHNSLGAALFAKVIGGETGERFSAEAAKENHRAIVEEAVRHFHEALGLEPQFPAAHNNLALALVYLGRREEALAEFDAAIRSDPRMAQAYFGKGATLAGMGRYDAAAQSLARAVQLKPDYFEASAKLGQCRMELKQYAAAVRAFQDALRARPDHARTHNDLGIALAMSNNLPAARDQFRRALDLDPHLASARQNLDAANHALAAQTRPAATQP
jgi:tetratricopeptide (TPR) repeat protein